MRILIADDDEISLEILENALTKAGYEVTTAGNGREALRLALEESFRLIVSDWDMPELNGLDLCRALRSEDLGGYVYFILLTARNSSAEIVEGLSAGADDFVAKPFNAAELTVRVRSGERILGMETREMAIFALAKLAESRDPETGQHLERVRDYCGVLARQVALMPKYRDEVDAEFIRLIYQTSPLHDIGKVGIPDSVLLKAGKFSADEFEIMKQHTRMGAATLEAALERYPEARFLRIARDIALTHHERYDGSGYPLGLRGEAIPLCGRIVALADVYDALTSRRVYKPAFEHAVARTILLKDSGTHFDPDIVDAFLAVEQAFIAIRARYHEEASDRDHSSASGVSSRMINS